MSKVAQVVLTGAFLISGGWASAVAQDTISLYGDTGDGLARFISTGSDPFDIVVLAKTNHVVRASIALVITELGQTAPGVFRVGVEPDFGTVAYVEGQGVTEYAVSSGAECVGSGPFEVLRITYLDMSGTSVGSDTVLGTRGLQPGDSSGSGHPDGSISTVACYLEDCPLTDPPYWCRIPLALEPWSESGMPDREDLAGAVVLNPTWLPISNETVGMSALKTRF